ncbi:MAG: flagellar biosynthetic protein FliO [Lachnospiraceae bacterium]|nr:flagellar biosynthetic protein FliO [Lachnospiraceae bacterium]
MSALLTMTSKVDSAAQFVTVLFAFVFVLAITLVGTRLVGNYQKRQSYSKNFESIEAYGLSNNKYLQLVRIGQRYFVIAVSKDNVTVVTEVEEKELELTEDGAPGGGFGGLLSKAKDKLAGRGNQSDE